MKTYHGSCHCKAIKYEVTLDISEGIHKCNCTYCYKTKYQKVFAKFENLKVTSGKELLSDYRGPDSAWPKDHIHHHFCTTCGVQLFSKGFLEMGKEPFTGWFYAVNIATLDDMTPQEIIAAPVIYEDGLHDKQLEVPQETRHL